MLIYQVLYNMSMWTAKEKSLSYDQAKADAANAQKDVKIVRRPFRNSRFRFGSSSEELGLSHPLSILFLLLLKYEFFPCFFQGPFDAVRKLLSGAESSKMNLNEKSDLFFCDYSIMPLFVQENYLMVEPGGGR